MLSITYLDNSIDNLIIKCLDILITAIGECNMEVKCRIAQSNIPLVKNILCIGFAYLLTTPVTTGSFLKPSIFAFAPHKPFYFHDPENPIKP